VIGYLDTSAFVPLLVAEPSSPSYRRFWDDADYRPGARRYPDTAGSDVVPSRGKSRRTGTLVASATVHLRAMTEADTDAVLSLNEASVADLSPLDAEELARLRGLAERDEVVEVDGQVAAFVLILGPDADYDSANYRWFTERYEDFGYLDRIVVGQQWRRQGIGRLIYDDVERAATARGRLACEVNAEPPNHASLAFHAARGYVEVGQLRHEGGKVTAMLVKELSPCVRARSVPARPRGSR